MTTTSNYGWTLPTVGSDADAWGGYLNTNFTGIDTTVKAVSDIANAALAKAGGTMTGALVCAVGTVSLPGITFAGDLNSGFYWVGADNIALTLGGTKRIDFLAAGAAITGTLSISGVTTATGGVVGALTGNVTGNVTGNLTGAVTGNASTATALATGRTIGMTGDVTWTTGTFDGSANVTAAGTLATVNGAAGTFAYATVTVNGKGLATTVTAGTAPALTGTFTSSDQTITAGGTLTLAHSLGTTPLLVQAFLVCTSANLNYSTGNIVPVGDLAHQIASNDLGHTMRLDATNITVRFGSNANVYALLDATTGAVAAIDPTKWTLRIRAWK